MTDRELFQLAARALDNAYAPYSHFQVGACLLSKDGRTFSGCNIENASYGAAICAERCAVSCAVSQGVREFEAIAVAGRESFAWPCGHLPPDVERIRAGAEGDLRKRQHRRIYRGDPAQLLPRAFGPRRRAGLRRKDR